MGTTAKGVAGGLATLDENALLPAEQLPDGMGAQAAAVTDQAALTYSAPAAQTSSAQAALTAAAAAGGTPTKTEFDKTVADAVAARTVVNQLVADVTAMRTALVALGVDVTAGRTKTNALLASLRTAELLAP